MGRFVCRTRGLSVADERVSSAAMSITVTVENDMIRLPADVHLPDGTRLEITLPEEGARPSTAAEPNFLARAKAIWGEQPAGKPLSALVSESRN